MLSKFFNVVISNWMRTYEATFEDDTTIRSLVDRLGWEEPHTSWIREYNEKLLAHTKDKEASGGTMFVSPRDFATIEDMKRWAEMINGPTLVDPPVENNADVLGDVLELTRVERLILNLAICLERAEYYEQSVFKSFRYEDKMETSYARLLNVSAEDIRKARREGFLFQSGLMVSWEESRCLYTIHRDLVAAFTKRDMTVETLAQDIFPSDISTELTPDNYPHLTKEIGRTEHIISEGLKSKQKGMNVLFWGIPGTGKTELAIALAKKHDWKLIVIGDISAKDAHEKSRAERLTSLKIAQKLYARDDNVVLFFDEIEDLFKKEDTNAAFSKAFINRIIENTTCPIIWTTNVLEVLGSAVLRRMVYNIEFDVPPPSARKAILQNYAEKYGVALDEDVIEELASTFETVPALLNNALKITKLANVPVADVPEILTSLDTLVNYGEKRKVDVTVRNDTPYDLTCVNCDTDLNVLADKLLKAKPGFSMCLYGAPGTGKSEFGRHLAKVLKKRVLYKRYSDLASMWLGQSEKNIAKAFKEAKESGKVLIIDEGDSFLRDRTKAKNSWEVTEVNEMLSQMEMHTEPFILTTNLMDDLDPACLRRFTFKVKFNYMMPEQANRLFKSYFGVDAPLALGRLETVTPGDYAAVRKQVDILGLTDADEIFELVLKESELKPASQMRIGFR